MAFIIRGQRRRRDVVAAAPDLHLRIAVLFGRLDLVEALQRAVVALVQAPAFFHGSHMRSISSSAIHSVRMARLSTEV